MATDLDWIRFALGVVASVVYVLVGVTVGRRRTSKDATLGIRAFQLWWYGLASLTVFTPLMKALDLAETGALDLFAVRVFLLQVAIIIIMAAIFGLLYYLFYVYAGKTWVVWPVAIYALLELAILITLISQAHPISYGPGCPGEAFCYEKEIGGGSTSSLLTLSFFVPILLATVAYFALYFRLENAVQKRRVALVAGGLALWFGSGLVASFVQGDFETIKGIVEHVPLSQWTYWSSIVSPLISLVASLIILQAYRLPMPSGTPPPAPEGAH